MLGLGLSATDQSHDPGQERQRSLPGGVEEPLLGQNALERLDAGEEFAHPDRANVTGLKLKRTAPFPEGGLGVHDDVCAFGEGIELARDGLDEHGHR